VQVRPSIIPFRESQRAASPVSWRNELATSIFWPQQCAGTYGLDLRGEMFDPAANDHLLLASSKPEIYP
jgi:hypothetical protein